MEKAGANSLFWTKVEKNGPEGCWLWRGNIHRTGYGIYSHTQAHIYLNGHAPEGLEWDHLCRVKHCVNPAHLQAVPHKVNIQRGKRGEHRYCHRGHPLSGDNLRIEKHGYRRCIACERERYERRREELP